MKRILLGLLALGLLAAGEGQAEAEYLFTPLENLNPSARNTVGLGINNLGQIVGADQDTFRGFLLSGTSYSLLAPFGIGSQAFGINDSGDIVGRFTLPPMMTHGFLYSGGRYTQIDAPPPGAQSGANGINNAGQIVGDFLSGVGAAYQGFVLSSGSYTTFSVPGAGVTTPYKINDAGQIVGVYAKELGSGYHGFVLSGGSYATIDVPGATETIVGGINNLGQIVGYYLAGSTQHGFLLSGGSFTTVDVPDSTVTAIWGINDAGQIVGGYLDTASVLHGFVATPSPEPSTFLLLSFASLGFIALARYSKPRSHSVPNDWLPCPQPWRNAPTKVVRWRVTLTGMESPYRH
jgi:probable HAF family extracellular repeat protein